MSEIPPPHLPLTGACLCGAVRFELSAVPRAAGWCHCGRCRRRTGTGGSLSALAAPGTFRFLQGADAVRAWQFPTGLAKSFCGRCGAHLFAGDPLGDDPFAIRFGAFDEDPGVRPGWHQWVSSAPVWETLPDDGLPRYEAARP